MTDKEIEKIDYIINRLIQFESSVSSNDLHRDGYYNEYNDNDKKIEQDFALLMLTLDELGILDKVSTKQGDFINYTPQVLQFKKTHGSFKNYCEKLKEKSIVNESELQKEKERKQKQDKKLDIDIYLGEFEKKQGAKFKQWGFVILVINLIIVLSGIFISNQTNKQKENQETDQQEQIEKKLDRLENQILTLERKSDSLNYQNHETNGQPK